MNPEPRFSIIAAMMGDPTRARMLAALMGGQYLAAGELAQAAGVTAATASAHLSKLTEHELVAMRVQGRHRYFRLANADIAHALEALSVVAERNPCLERWNQGAYKPLKAARTCYGHIAGELGVALFQGLLARGSLVPHEGQFTLTETGRAELEALGVPVPKAGSPRWAYPCLDWSERTDHLAGSLAHALMEHGLAQDWWQRTQGSRALRLTPKGKKVLSPWLEAGSAP
jgi:DNA-binding transcriptional ArsR family regulator